MTVFKKPKRFNAEEIVIEIHNYNDSTIPDWAKDNESYRGFHLSYGVPKSLFDEDADILQDCSFNLIEQMEGRGGVAFRAELSYKDVFILPIHNDGNGGSDFFEDYGDEGRAAMEFFQDLADRIGLEGGENVTELCTTVELLEIIKAEHLED